MNRRLSRIDEEIRIHYTVIKKISGDIKMNLNVKRLLFLLPFLVIAAYLLIQAL